MNKKIVLDPDWTLQWLIDCGYVEKTDSAFSPYRIATDPSTNRPYTVTGIVKSLRMYKRNLSRSNHSRPFCRELKKCFDEYNITYMTLFDHCMLCNEMKPNRLKELEEDLGVNLDPLSKDERRKVSIIYSKHKKAVGKEEAQKRLYIYIQRRLKNPGGDLRTGKVGKYGPIEDDPKCHHSDQTSSFQPEDIVLVSGMLQSYHNGYCNDHYGQRYDESLNEHH